MGGYHRATIDIFDRPRTRLDQVPPKVRGQRRALTLKTRINSEFNRGRLEWQQSHERHHVGKRRWQVKRFHTLAGSRTIVSMTIRNQHPRQDLNLQPTD